MTVVSIRPSGYSTTVFLCFEKIYCSVKGSTYVGYVILVKDGNTENCRFQQTVESVVNNFYVNVFKFFRLNSFNKNCTSKVAQADYSAANSFVCINSRFFELHKVVEKNAEELFIVFDRICKS